MKNKVVRVYFLFLLGLTFCAQSCHSGSQNTQNRLQEAEELYRQGISSNSSSQYESSTAYLKQAEEVLLSIQPSVVSNQQRARRNQLLGLTWFRLGNTSESEMLYDIAQNYYRKAIPMLDPESNAVYLACAYRDIARTMAIAGGEQDSVLWYFAQAERYAREANRLQL